MDKKRLVFIIAGAVVAVAAVIVVLGLLTRPAAQEGTGGPAADVNTALTDAEKASIKGSTETYIKELGNFGWYPDLIKNPTGLVDKYTLEAFYKQEHTTVEESQAVLRDLTNSTEYDASVNADAYNAPFSVETSLTGEIAIPDYPAAEGNQTLVTVTAPVKSILSYISTSTAYTDMNGNKIESETYVRILEYDGQVELKFAKSGGSWRIIGFSDTVGVFATDNFFVVNGDLVVDATPVSEQSNKVN